MSLPRRRLARADGSPCPAGQSNHGHRCHRDDEAGGHAALDAALDVAVDVAFDAAFDAALDDTPDPSTLSKISIGPRLTRDLPRNVPQSVPRTLTYPGKLCVKAGGPGPAASGPAGRALSAAVESGPDRTHELAELTGRCTVQRSAHQG